MPPKPPGPRRRRNPPEGESPDQRPLSAGYLVLESAVARAGGVRALARQVKASPGYVGDALSRRSFSSMALLQRIATSDLFPPEIHSAIVFASQISTDDTLSVTIDRLTQVFNLFTGQLAVFLAFLPALLSFVPPGFEVASLDFGDVLIASNKYVDTLTIADVKDLLAPGPSKPDLLSSLFILDATIRKHGATDPEFATTAQSGIERLLHILLPFWPSPSPSESIHKGTQKKEAPLDPPRRRGRPRKAQPSD